MNLYDDEFDYLTKYGYITFEFRTDAEKFTGRLLYKKIPFRVGYKMNGAVIVYDMRNLEDGGK